ncbi:MAG: O-antigen ligase family protein [Solirubrobacteraceae bacterium]
MRVRRAAPFIPAGLVLILWLAWIPASGAYFPATWYPSAAAAASLAIISCVGHGRLLPTTPAARVALLAFAALVGLNYLSILWAGSPGDALQAANQLLLYLAVAWTIALVPWTPSTLAAILGLWSVGVAAFCGVDLARAVAAHNLTPFFYSTRYATPLQYPNATAALSAMAIWPALLLSARREAPVWARIPMLGVAAFLADFAFLPQSRGALVGIVLTAAVVVLVSGRRVALLLRMAIVGGALAVTIPRTVTVYQALTTGRLVRPVLQHTATAMLLTTLAALALSALLVAVEKWLVPTRIADWRPRRPGRRTVAAATLVAVLALAGGAVAAAPAVSRLTNSVWHSGNTDASTGSVRLLSATPEERFDYARAAVRLFAGSPAVGIGAGNFGRRYDAVRRLQKHSRYAHNLVLRVLSETGSVGVALLVLIIGALGIGLVRSIRDLSGTGRACGVAAVGMAAYFLIHSSFDWVDEFPVLAVPPLALALAAIGMRRPRALPPIPSAVSQRPARIAAHRPSPVLAAALGVALSCAVAAALGAPYLEARYIQAAVSTAASNPSQAFTDFSRATSINPLSADALISEGTIAVDLNDPTRARLAFTRAIGRTDTWYPRLELALLDAQAGQFAAALGQVRAAGSLDHDDPLVLQAWGMIQHRQRIDPIKFNQGFVSGAQSDIFRQPRIR